MRREDRNGLISASLSLTETQSVKQKLEGAEKTDERKM